MDKYLNVSKSQPLKVSTSQCLNVSMSQNLNVVRREEMPFGEERGALVEKRAGAQGKERLMVIFGHGNSGLGERSIGR